MAGRVRAWRAARKQRSYARRASPWGTGRLGAVIFGAAVLVVAFVTGLVLSVHYAISDHERAKGGHRHSSTSRASTASPGRSASGQQIAEDSLAMRPMMQFSAADAQAGQLSATAPGSLAVPAATRTGPQNVPTGFPHTPEGALAQMAVIDMTALQSKQLAAARQIIASWAAPVGPTGGSWDRVKVLATLMNDGELSDGDASLWSLQLTPVMGLIKGSVGPDFVVPCVDYELRLTINDITSPGYALGGCARMRWVGGAEGQWKVAAGRDGQQTAIAPSVWPDTDNAIKAGYKDLAGVSVLIGH